MQGYWDYAHRAKPVAAGARVEVPAGFAVFADTYRAEDLRPPRELVEDGFNVARWTTMPPGGHFAALEEPELLVEDIRAFFRPLRRA